MSKRVPADVYAWDKKIGTAEIQYEPKSRFKNPGHTHLFCPCCGRVWGKLIVNTWYPTTHHILNKACEEHGGGLFINEGTVHEWFSVEWSPGVYAHDFCTVYDKWLVGGVKPAEFSDGSQRGDVSWVLPVGDSQHPLKMPGEDKRFREVN